MTDSDGSTPLSSGRVLVTALTVTSVVLGLALVAAMIGVETHVSRRLKLITENYFLPGDTGVAFCCLARSTS